MVSVVCQKCLTGKLDDTSIDHIHLLNTFTMSSTINVSNTKLQHNFLYYTQSSYATIIKGILTCDHIIHLPIAVSGIANTVRSVATRNLPWTDKPTP